VPCFPLIRLLNKIRLREVYQKNSCKDQQKHLPIFLTTSSVWLGVAVMWSGIIKLRRTGNSRWEWWIILFRWQHRSLLKWMIKFQCSNNGTHDLDNSRIRAHSSSYRSTYRVLQPGSIFHVQEALFFQGYHETLVVRKCVLYINATEYTPYWETNSLNARQGNLCF
jgi:hypothetical protein